MQFEVVPNEPAPIVLSEIAHVPQLPTVVRFMVERRQYLALWNIHWGTIFFAPVLRENGHAVDYDRL